MVNAKIGGIVVGGLAGYLLLSKLMSTADGIVYRICEASKWKAYYKYGKDGLMVPPGYSSHTHKINDEEELVVEDDSQKQQSGGSQDPSKNDYGAQLAKAITKAVDKWVDGKKDEEEASEAVKTGDTDGDEIQAVPFNDQVFQTAFQMNEETEEEHNDETRD